MQRNILKVLFISIFLCIASHSQSVFGKGERSMQVMPSGGANYADGLFDMLDQGAWLIFDIPSRDPEIVKWLSRNGYSKQEVRERYSAVARRAGIKLLSSQQAIQLAREKQIEVTKIVVFWTVDMKGDVAAANMRAVMSRPVEIPGQDSVTPAIVWDSGGVTGLATGSRRRELIEMNLRSELAQFEEALMAAKSIKKEPLTYEDFEQAGRGNHPRAMKHKARKAALGR